MMRMQEDEFDEITPTTIPGGHCKHEVAKLFVNATHTDYGCIKCKMKSLILENFN